MPKTYSNCTLVLPTLNEERTIGQLVSLVLENYPGMAILVVDDGSTDRTRPIVDSKKNKNVKLIDRSRCKKKGLTASVIEGVLSAKTEYVIVMDSDLQHPPEKIREIVALLMEGKDLVVGCRNRIKKWKWHRRIISVGAMALAKASLRLSGSPSCSDVMSGFFGVRRELAVATIASNRHRFQEDGYKVLYDLLKCMPGKTTVSEVGYDFGMRRVGTSKIGLKHIVAFLLSLFR